MKIVVCSGKGGTGKTTVATSLFLSLSEHYQTWFVDCDVEAPNGYLFLKPEIQDVQQAVINIPQIDETKCTACGNCVKVCQFHALALIQNKVIVFPQLCHGCGSCTWNCPEAAIEEIPRAIGTLERGTLEKGAGFLQGVLTISEPMPTPIIRQLKKWHTFSSNEIVILDAPPGASCSVVETLRHADFALLVTEPTPYGLHDLKQVVGILAELNISFGVCINRDGIGDQGVEQYLSENYIPLLMRIPFDRAVAEGIASGKTLLEIKPEFNQHMLKLFEDIKEHIKRYPDGSG
jgi:MinD superfamily P-loop ATPase